MLENDEIGFGKEFGIPRGLVNARYDLNDDISPYYDIVNESPNSSTSSSTTIDPITSAPYVASTQMFVVSQTTRTSTDGTTVVDVTMEYSAIEGTQYETRYSALVN